MNYRSIIVSCLFASCILLFSGCGGEQLPPGIPKLYPATLTVMQDGKPLADAEIIMINVDPSTNWSAGGVTDQNGVLKLRTMGRYNGAPVGKYKVAVQKTETPDISLPYDPPYDPPSDPAELREYNRLVKEIRDNTFLLVDEKFSIEKTELEVEITPTELKVTVDVSPAVRVKPQVQPTG